jgi:hypothetical protein
LEFRTQGVEFGRCTHSPSPLHTGGERQAQLTTNDR